MPEVSLVRYGDLLELEFNQGVGALAVLGFIYLEGGEFNAAAGA